MVGGDAGKKTMVAAIGQGVCSCFFVCEESTKNKEESKIMNVPYLRAYDAPPLAIINFLARRPMWDDASVVQAWVAQNS